MTVRILALFIPYKFTQIFITDHVIFSIANCVLNLKWRSWLWLLKFHHCWP